MKTKRLKRKPVAPARVGCSDLLGAKELCVLIGLTRWIAQTQMALQRNLIRLENRYGSLAKWFIIEGTSTNRTNMRLLVKPSKATRNLLATGIALCQNKRGVQRTARAKKLLYILRRDLHKAPNKQIT